MVHIGLLDEEFLAELHGPPQMNLTLEMLRQLLNNEIKVRGRRNVRRVRSFAVILEKTGMRYQNRSLKTAQASNELLVLAKQMKAAQRRGKDPGLSASYFGLAAELAYLAGYQEQQQVEHAPLAEQISDVKSLIETVGRKIKRLASLRGNATDDEEASQYTSDLEAAKDEKTGLRRKLKKIEADYRWEDVITDDDIIAVLAMREVDIKKLKRATFEDMRRYLAKIDLRVEVKDRIATMTCKLPVLRPAQGVDDWRERLVP